MSGLKHADVVLVANQFNPSILSEHWLVTRGILPERGEDRELAYLPGFVAVKTAQFVIEARSDRVQFTIVHPEGEQTLSIVTETVGAIVRNLPETPYVGMGFNYEWVGLSKNIEHFMAESRRMFFKSDSPLSDFFDAPDARFGAYLSRAFEAFRLRLLIRPIKPTDVSGEVVEGLLYQFNFHTDIGEDEPVAEILDRLTEWSETRAESERIFQSTAGWLDNGNNDAG